MTKTGNKELIEQCKLYEADLNKEDEAADDSEDNSAVVKTR